MIRRLIILLLIVGCAPTTATFYIGMNEDEFKNKNPHIKKHTIQDYNNSNVYIENTGIIPAGHVTSQRYIFLFNNDTLSGVYRGILNTIQNNSEKVAIKIEIDYSKYPGSLPE